MLYNYTSHGIKMCNVFLGTNNIATIEHRCVTHLYGRNSIGRAGSGQ